MSLLILAAASAAAAPCAADEDDSAALALVGSALAAVPHQASLTAEAAFTDAAQRTGGSDYEERLSLDFRFDAAWSPQWRTIFADRLDVDQFQGGGSGSQQVNTLKEAYASFQPKPYLLLDAGRINARQGVAYGYNPTDYFRADALRTIDSLDPNTLRDERLGTAMLRTERVWDSGALTALFAPRLTAAPNPTAPTAGPFSADWAATNSTNRYLVSLTQKIMGLTPQWLLFKTEHGAPQFGVDVTSVFGDSTVAYLEASGGRSRSLLEQALEIPGSESLRGRAAAGLTYSTSGKLSVTLEYEYDGAALGPAGWAAARSGNLLTYARYRNFVNAQQELPTRQGLFTYITWQDLAVKHLDLTAFVRLDLIDHSRLPWAELRYHWSRIDAAMRWQNFLGSRTSDYGAAASGQTWQAVIDYFY